ncbi:hypothetical protein HanRHA438_Chr01g0042491 [Helianthus annuus]|uniref:Uncharacterized protein n=1 Tax=Helianthus annuus TaxID=4232 RepID=A0A251VSP4_HELAN|nr:UPF0481 protein At3g47200 [Helianthus annuus]KAF5823743.1 hypothetical protein HanXRQr2_Chr01g0041591 [Helianthus annuus]KAJ0613052.1 hypothetical protein HanHA300_Chr01g0034031 [Helianthus annuus]KAJ0628431.1 hypothetical protein HanHA89_Chr01g0036481 [Helianthus annuus]KAJ0784710.1 hypothetical protein HanLR1_Chr01g0034901 [Helianthus annuus]KAJ0949796.1 hypothetical protein HanRHA438_Chr01g0042491 [Helianthus annuus]
MDNIGSQSVEHHAVTIWEINRDRLTAMQHKLSDTPKLLSVAAGRTTCSIFKVPQTLIDINGKSYQPHIVSVGPFHHGQPHLEMIEEHKWRFLRQLLNRTQAKGMVLEDYLRAVQPLEARARECYSLTIPYTTDEFIEMMVLDGCFIIELFRKIGGLVEVEDYDPLITMSWIVSFFLRDLVRLENQIPYFVLDCLFQLTKTPESPTLAMLALGFFNLALQRPDTVLEKYSNVKAKHLLDLLRTSFLPSDLEHSTKPDNRPPPHVIHSISKLRRSGIKLKPWEAESFLVVNFKHGVIHMPTIAIDDFMCAFLLNAVAFEQCHSGCLKIVTTYATLLDCLINTSKDVELLCDWNIIENYLGTDAEVATFINNMGKDVTFDIDVCYLARLFDNVNRHYHSGWHVQLASFKYTYFNTPWSLISAMAALLLLILTVAQTLYTVLSYVNR